MRFRLALAVAAAAVAVGIGGYYASLHTSVPASGPLAAKALVDQVAAVLAPRASAEDGPQSTISDAQRSEIEGIIRNYLIANPEIIRDAINELQRKEDDAARVAQATTIKDNADLIFSSPREVVLGNPDGDVTLVEFFDYNCAYCRRAAGDMKRLIADDPNLRVVLKEFPILGQGSVEAAQVAVALLLTAPEKYGDFHDALLSEPGQVDGERALAVAEDLGVDPEILKAKLNSDEVKAAIIEAQALAQKLDLTGTPSYVTARQVVVGAVGYDALKSEIQAVRDCQQQATC
jgi:protein-disulfide isomerase